MIKEKIKLSPESIQKIDELLGVIAGAEKEIGLVLGRASNLSSNPDLIVPSIPPSALEFIGKIRVPRTAPESSYFAFFYNMNNGEGGVYNELEGTCTPLEK